MAWSWGTCTVGITVEMPTLPFTDGAGRKQREMGMAICFFDAVKCVLRRPD